MVDVVSERKAAVLTRHRLEQPPKSSVITAQRITHMPASIYCGLRTNCPLRTSAEMSTQTSKRFRWASPR